MNTCFTVVIAESHVALVKCICNSNGMGIIWQIGYINTIKTKQLSLKINKLAILSDVKVEIISIQAKKA